ncbi:MAG TPA: hypothetical protein ENK82_05630 [Campylobacterales bacterium]|nr:hypothetical protein [Campylobacterales bacterium]HHS92808.1 hypothetical protein [Campylobacterales bacterium]
MKKFSIIAIVVATLFATLTLLNAQTAPKTEPFPVAQTGTQKACCANKQKPVEKKCDKEKCDMTKKECDKSKCKREK